MATAEQVKALLHSHAEGNEERFYAIALQVAAQAARTGQVRKAQELRDLVDRLRARTAERPPEARPIPLAQPKGELAGLFTVSYPGTKLGDLVLDQKTRKRLERVLTEQRNRARLGEHGLRPQRKLLLVGPPGTGKTFTATAMAGELGWPLCTIQLHVLITKFLGETAAKLRVVFDAMQETRGVFFFDEVDALAGERSSGHDVGEIRRVLNSFLMFLEQDDSESVVIAATNHRSLLDRALFRRFDAVVEYALPTPEGAVDVMRARLAVVDTKGMDWVSAGKAAAGMSHADISRACDDAAKNAILADEVRVDTDALLQAIAERREDGPGGMHAG